MSKHTIEDLSEKLNKVISDITIINLTIENHKEDIKDIKKSNKTMIETISTLNLNIHDLNLNIVSVLKGLKIGAYLVFGSISVMVFLYKTGVLDLLFKV